MKNGADPKVNGSLALRIASFNGSIEIVDLLLQKGADPTAGNSEALAYAALNNHIEIFKLLLDKGANASDALVCGSMWTIGMLKDYLGTGANPKEKGNEFFLNRSGFRIDILNCFLGQGIMP